MSKPKWEDTAGPFEELDREDGRWMLGAIACLVGVVAWFSVAARVFA